LPSTLFPRVFTYFFHRTKKIPNEKISSSSNRVASFVIIQPDTDVLNVELTMFRQHCDDNMPDIKTVEDAPRCARERQTIFPLTSRCFELPWQRRLYPHRVNTAFQNLN
jgi:hypothetical protein